MNIITNPRVASDTRFVNIWMNCPGGKLIVTGGKRKGQNKFDSHRAEKNEYQPYGRIAGVNVNRKKEEKGSNEIEHLFTMHIKLFQLLVAQWQNDGIS